MTFTYDSTSIATDLAKVRFLVGDTISASALLTDEEITWVLGQESSNVYLSAAKCADKLAMGFARAYDISTDGQSLRRSQMSAQYRELAQELRNRAYSVTTIVPTRVDGYSVDIPADEVLTADVNPRRRFYGQPDRVP